MSEVELSVVAPVFNEQGVVVELVRRCAAAAAQVSENFEVIVVDDASRDDTSRLLAQACDGERTRTLRLEHNRGQFGATQAGLAAARGRIVVVLDGDLQDPPEAIPGLVQALREAPERVDATFAVKVRRDDPSWFHVGRAGYHVLQSGLARHRVPSGAGSFCVMRSGLAARIGRLPPQRSNLSAVVVSLGAEVKSVPYDKVARYDGQSRVGLRGLVREALASLVLTGAAERWLLVVAGVFASLVMAVSAAPGGYQPGRTLVFGLFVVALEGARTCASRRRAMLAKEREPW